MRGASRRERRATALALSTGWHAANFGRARKLEALDVYLRKLEPAPTATPTAAADEAAAAWGALAARGLVKIREVERTRDV